MNFVLRLTAIWLFSLPTAYAAKGAGGTSPTGMAPEALGAKAFLEDVLARRYAQELATMIDKNAFSLGAQLDLVEVPKPVKPAAPTPAPESDVFNDLSLGTLDPEELVKKFVKDEEKEPARGFLASYRIRTVTVSVGLKEEMGADIKSTVEAWLNARLAKEFAKNGKGNVSFISTPASKKGLAMNFWDWLNQFQSLAGQLVMALALLLGILLWRLLGGSTSTAKTVGGETAPAFAAPTAPAPSPAEALAKAESENQAKLEKEARVRTSEQITNLSLRLSELAPRLTKDLESIVRSWVQMGETGKLRLACFAEAVGRDIGRLPIPVDALSDITKVFSGMSLLSLEAKRDALEKAYWDLLSALNLGAESLNQPFGYMGGLSLDMVNQVLIDQNPKMKTLVSIFMPSDLRSRFVRSLTIEDKRELLRSAAQMTQVEVGELKTLDGTLLDRIKPSSAAGTVPLEMTLNKVAAALAPAEALLLLPDMKGSAIDTFKRTVPSLAFLGEWTDSSLSVLLASAASDEVTALLRVRGDLKNRILNLCPPMTAEIIGDELTLPDKLSEADKSRLIEEFTQRLEALVADKVLNLADVFAATAAPTLALVPDANKFAA